MANVRAHLTWNAKGLILKRFSQIFLQYLFKSVQNIQDYFTIVVKL